MTAKLSAEKFNEIFFSIKYVTKKQRKALGLKTHQRAKALNMLRHRAVAEYFKAA